MLNLKRILPKTLTHNRSLLFSTNTRIRNFFEVDPIFPDFNDPENFKKPERLHIGQSDIDQRELFNRFGEAVLEKVTKKLSSDKRAKRKSTKSEREARLQKWQEEVQLLSERIIEDPDLKFPYGFGFDSYIVTLKGKRLASSGDNFVYALNNIFSRLSALDDIQLIEARKEAVLAKTSKDFVDVARSVIVDHVVREIENIRKNGQGDKFTLSKLLAKQSVIDNALKGQQSLETLREDISSNLNEERVNFAASHIAEASYNYKAEINKRMREKEFRKNVQDFDFLKYRDPAFPDLGKTEMLPGDDFVPFIPPFDDPKGHNLSAEDYRKFKIQEEIKSKYLRKRNKVIEERFTSGAKATIAPNAEEGAFFKSLNEDPRLLHAEKVLGLNNKPQPKFEEIFDEVDKLIINAPLSIKRAIKDSEAQENTNFSPKISAMAINPDELLWGNISSYLTPVIPEAYLNRNKEPRKNARYEAPEPEQVQVKETEDNSFDISEITPQLNKEIEVYKMVKREPFFLHYITNELRYYADRMDDAILANYLNDPFVVRFGDHFKNDETLLKKIVEYKEKEAALEPVLYDGRAFGKGHRKTCHALAIIKEGTGKITINRKAFIDYFGQPSHRALIVQPLSLTRLAAEVDVDLFLWGSGVTAQGYAGRMALSKALINWDPNLKKILKECKVNDIFVNGRCYA